MGGKEGGGGIEGVTGCTGKRMRENGRGRGRTSNSVRHHITPWMHLNQLMQEEQYREEEAQIQILKPSINYDNPQPFQVNPSHPLSIIKWFIVTFKACSFGSSRMWRTDSDVEVVCQNDPSLI